MDIKNNFTNLDKYLIFFVIALIILGVLCTTILWNAINYLVILLSGLIIFLLFVVMHILRSEFLLTSERNESLKKKFLQPRRDYMNLENKIIATRQKLEHKINIESQNILEVKEILFLLTNEFKELKQNLELKKDISSNIKKGTNNLLKKNNLSVIPANNFFNTSKVLEFDLNSFFDKIYVINLKRRKDRRKAMISKLNKVDLNYEFFEAVDGRKYQEKFDKTYKGKEYWGRINSAGAIGLIKTYKKILKKVLKTPEINNILLLEDDIYFHKKFTVLIKETQVIFDQYDVVYIGANQQRFSDEQTIQMENGIGYEIAKDKHYITFGTYGIALSRKFIKHLYEKIQYLTEKSVTIDVEIFCILAESNELNGFVFYPNLVLPETRESDNMGARDLKEMAKSRKWNLSDYQLENENRFVFVVASYNNKKNYKKNLNSIYQQKYKNYRVIYIDDCSEDGTYNLVENFKRNNTILIKNIHNYGPAYSRYLGYMMCEEEEIVIFLDGDDFLYDSKVLNRLNDYYDNGYDFTFGSFRLMEKGYNRIAEDYPIEVIKEKSYRKYELPPSHLRTTYARNIKNISFLDLLDGFGNFLQVSTDYLDMMHSLENCNNPKAIPQLLLLYNDKNSARYNTSWFKRERNKEYRDYINDYLLSEPRKEINNKPFVEGRKTIVVPIELYFLDRGLFLYLIKKIVYEHKDYNLLVINPKDIAHYNLTEYEIWNKCKLENKITYLIPNYNNEKFIENCLNSLFSQTFQDFYVIICDDASTDKSREILSNIKDERVTILYNEKNLQVGLTTEKMLIHSKTIWNAILDGDDAVTENNSFELNAAINYVDWKKVSMIYSNFYYCDPNMKILYRGFSKQIQKGKTNLELDCVSHTRVLNKYFFYQTTGFDKDMTIAEDKDIIYKMEELGELFFINQQLYLYRKNSSSLTHNYDKDEYFDIAKEKAHNRRHNQKVVNEFVKRPKIIKKV